MNITITCPEETCVKCEIKAEKTPTLLQWRGDAWYIAQIQKPIGWVDGPYGALCDVCGKEYQAAIEDFRQAPITKDERKRILPPVARVPIIHTPVPAMLPESAPIPTVVAPPPSQRVTNTQRIAPVMVRTIPTPSLVASPPPAVMTPAPIAERPRSPIPIPAAQKKLIS